MSGSNFQSLLMESGGGLTPVDNCEVDPYYTTGPENDPYWNNVVLQLHFNGSITDTSATGATFTNFDCTIDSSVKKFGSGSLALNGPGAFNYLVSDNQTAFYLDGDFTIEFWCRTTASFSGPLIGVYEQATGIRDWFISSSFGNIGGTVRINVGGSTSTLSAINFAGLVIGVWRHVALCRIGNGFILYVDGRQVASITSSYVPPSGARYIEIGNNGSTAASTLPGNIDDIRITKGVARYTGQFTPPTREFPDALETTWSESDPRTIFLWHAENPIAEEIFSAPLTANANDQINYNGELAGTSVTDPTAITYGVNGGTFTVDNSDNRILYTGTKVQPLNTHESLFTCDVVVTGSFSGTGAGSGPDVFVLGNSSAQQFTGFRVSVNSNQLRLILIRYDTANNDSIYGAISSSFSLGLRFNFLANTITWEYNGEPIRVDVVASKFFPTTYICVGPSATTHNISTVRISNLKAQYLEPTDFVEYQRKNMYLRRYTTYSNVEAKFNDYSALVSTGGVNVTAGTVVQNHQDFNFGTSDWTLEFWAYRINNTSVGRLFTGLSSSAQMAEVGTDGLLDVTWVTSGGTQSRPNIASIPTGQWVHCVFQRRSNVFEVYVDGILEDSVAVSGSGASTSSTDFILGGFVTNSFTNWTGYIDEVRITKNAARYTTNFTPQGRPWCPAYGEILPTSGTEYPTTQLATLQQGNIALLNHFQPLSGQQLTTVQGYATIGAIPTTPILQYTTLSQPESSGRSVSVQLTGVLLFDTFGNIAYTGFYTYTVPSLSGTATSKWLNPSTSQNGSNFEIQIIPSYNIYYPPPAVPPNIGFDFAYSGTATFTPNGVGGNDIWNSMGVSRALPLYCNFNRSSSTQFNFVDVEFRVRPTAASGLIGPAFEKTYTIRINMIASRF